MALSGQLNKILFGPQGPRGPKGDPGASFPDPTGNNGKFLTTDGFFESWASVSQVPSQTSQAGKFLTTDGTNASWATAPGGGYTTVENAGSPVTQRTELNLTGRFVASDVSGKTLLDLNPNVNFAPGTYSPAILTVDGYGRVTAASSSTLAQGTGYAIYFQGAPQDSGTNAAHILDTTATLIASVIARLLSVRNNGSEKFGVDINGFFRSPSTMRWYINNVETITIFGGSTINLALTTLPTNHLLQDLGVSFSVWRNLWTGHIECDEAFAPAIAAGAGGDATATVSLLGDSTDTAGTIQCVAAGTPAASATIATITFSTPFTGTPRVILTPSNAAAQALSSGAAVYQANTTIALFKLTSGTALSAGTTYTWDYHVMASSIG